MINAINYYYNFNIDNLRNINGRYYFYHGNNKYILKEYSSYLDFNDIYKLSEFLKFRNSKFHSIVLNKNGEVCSLIDNKLYILYLININENRKVDFQDIVESEYFNVPFIKTNTSWRLLWINKVDQLEFTFRQRIINDKDILGIINYYIGLSEIAINLLKNMRRSSSSLSRIRVKEDEDLYDFYSLDNLVNDHYTRDISEYIKDVMLNFDNVDSMFDKLKKIEFREEDKKLILARVIFPTYFYDYLDNNIDDLESIKRFIPKIRVYENNLLRLIDILEIKKE